MSEFNFKSAICTSRELSERLLALGLKKKTADMCWTKMARKSGTFYVPELAPINMVPWRHTPAWSLHRLIEMIPTHIYQGEHEFYRTIKPHSILYMPVDMESMWSIGRVVVNANNYYDGIIEMYEWLIKEGYFNKEYLENGND